MLLIGSLLTLAVCAAALVAGGAPERQTAVLLLTSLALTSLLQFLAGAAQQLPVALTDILLAGCLVGLAMYHRRRWLAAMAAIGFGLVLTHAIIFDLRPSLLLVALVDGLNLLGLLVLLAATLMAARARRTQRLQARPEGAGWRSR